MVGIIGAGKSGCAAARLAVSLGAMVLLSDARPRPVGFRAPRGVLVEFGGHSDRLLSVDMIIKSPGVHQDIPVLVAARKKGIVVVSELEFAFRQIAPRRLIAITGTNGKTTSTALMGALCKAADFTTVVAGNIGTPLSACVPGISPRTALVLEVSSYQLEDSLSFHPTVSAILNITPDHLEHHHSLKNYIAAKANIFARQTRRDVCVLNYDDPACRALARRCPARVVFFSRRKRLSTGVSYLPGKRGAVIRAAFAKTSFSVPADLKLPGMHNIENVLACVAMAAAVGIPPTTIAKGIASFRGVEHRIEFVRELDGVRYINDSKGTNVDSTRVALESFDRPVWLILGGRDKGAPYAPLRPLLTRAVKGILLIGEAAPVIRRQLAGTAPCHDCGTLARAVLMARQKASPGDVVLLSPACASFDQFMDYEDRGRRFKALVRQLS